MTRKTLSLAAALFFISAVAGYIVTDHFMNAEPASVADSTSSGYYPHPVGPGAGPPIRH